MNPRPSSPAIAVLPAAANAAAAPAVTPITPISAAPSTMRQWTGTPSRPLPTADEGLPTRHQAGLPGVDAHLDLYDPEYCAWRAERMRQFDEEYVRWRQERFRRFSEEFDTWRKGRGAAAVAPGAEPVGVVKVAVDAPSASVAARVDEAGAPWRAATPSSDHGALQRDVQPGDRPLSSSSGSSAIGGDDEGATRNRTKPPLSAGEPPRKP